MIKKANFLMLACGMLANTSFISLSVAKHVDRDIVMIQDSISILKKQIARFPDSLELHQQFLKSTDIESAETELQYSKWTKKYKESAVVPFAYGSALLDKYDHHAEKWLQEAVTRNPSYGAAWFELSLYADFSGDAAQSAEYLRRATEAEPENPDYAFYYANRLYRDDVTSYEEATFAFVNKFSKSQRAAQALYWLAHRFEDQSRKIEIYEQLRKQYPVAEYAWSNAALSEYFSLLLDADIAKASQLAREFTEALSGDYKKAWSANFRFSEQVIAAKAFLQDNKGKEAMDLLNTLAPQRGSNARLITLLKAEAVAQCDGVERAYDMLSDIYVKNLDKSYLTVVNDYGTRLGKSSEAVRSDLASLISASAVQATPFALEQYYEDGKLSLDDLKGKVVLLTYWYPGCGPCRAEFPHFENVLKKYSKEDVVYLGINIVRKQDAFVLPFMTESKNTFIPLKEDTKRDKGNLDNGGAAPVNFLIDKEGKIAFSKFMINGGNEDMLESMIDILL